MPRRYDLERDDFLELWQEKMFLGQEFLTWLWLASEADNNFVLKDGAELTVFFDGSLKLERGLGDFKQSLTSQPPRRPDSQAWTEAFIGAARNKQVASAKLRVACREREWSLSLPADTLCPRGVRIMAAGDADKEAEEDGALARIGALLDRASLLSELNDHLEGLLTSFLELRLSQKWEGEELPRLRQWVRRWVKEGSKAAS
ncbi:MAG: hypothetical protein LBP95_10470 [Deltaproteobacteria bacterium]|jgi:recombination associated protein RdgC|nr:hypothetical protein [Deltaproteobacteria bacterium]